MGLSLTRVVSAPRRGQEGAVLPNVQSAEEWLAEVDRIVRSYRTLTALQPMTAYRQAAKDELCELGLTEADAIRYLDGPVGRARA